MTQKKAKASGGNIVDYVRRCTSGIMKESFGPQESWLKENRDLHQGETCFILGNGPSLKEVDNEVLSKYSSFGTNGIFLKFNPTYFVTISRDFFQNYISEISDLKCERKFVGEELANSFPNFDGSFLKCSWNLYGKCRGFYFPVPFRFSHRADRVVHLGGTVLAVCLQIAYHLGYQRVILLGVDHNFGFSRDEAGYGGRRIEVKGKDEMHFDSNYTPEGQSLHCDLFAIERSFELALKAFQDDGREILNATEGTGLDVIPKVKLEEII